MGGLKKLPHERRRGGTPRNPALPARSGPSALGTSRTNAHRRVAFGEYGRVLDLGDLRGAGLFGRLRLTSPEIVSGEGLVIERLVRIGPVIGRVVGVSALSVVVAEEYALAAVGTQRGC